MLFVYSLCLNRSAQLNSGAKVEQIKMRTFKHAVLFSGYTHVDSQWFTGKKRPLLS